MARTLASIQKITNIQPIEGASNIVLCSILGWRCVSNIENNFKIGELVIYIEIDSKVPSDNPSFAFLEKRGYKVKTMKFNKFNTISQGLIMPLSVLPETTIPGGIFPVEGADVTDILKVTKIDTDELDERIPNGSQNQHLVDRWLCKFKLYRKIRPYIFSKKDREWPKEIPHTDETRIQVLWNKLEPVFQLNKKWYITTKIDGQSASYYYKKRWFNDFFGIYSRTCKKKAGDNSNWDRMATKYKIKEALKKFGKTIWIQGEIAGPGIQKNKNRFDENRLFIFNVYIPKLKKYLGPVETRHFCNIFGFEMVPVLHFEESLAGKSIDDLVTMSNGPSEWSKDDLREGIVIREIEDCSLNRISFKVISPEFLTKYNL
jgi:hypothetical protein